jgi:hypothetical protein
MPLLWGLFVGILRVLLFPSGKGSRLGELKLASDYVIYVLGDKP